MCPRIKQHPHPGDVREPAASWRSVREELATEKRRTRGTKLRALLRDGWDETNASARAEEYTQALADSRRRFQLGFARAHDVGSREATGVEEPACCGFFFCFLGYSMASRGSKFEKHFVFNPTTAGTPKSLLSPLSAAPFERTGFCHGLLVLLCYKIRHIS